jgi:AraC-like DNA-binding protein
LIDSLYQPFPIATKARGQIWHHLPATRRPRHFHAEPELNLVTGGTGVFAMGEKVLPVAEGDLLWWPPGQDHVLVDASPDFDLFVIGVTADFSFRVLSGTPEAGCVGPIQVRLAPSDLAEIKGACAAARSATVDVPSIESKVGDLWRRTHALRRTALCAFRNEQGPFLESMHAVTRRTMVSLYARPEMARSEVARLVRTDPTEVSRYFHGDMGTTLSAFRARLRLLRFIEAVDDGAESLLAAALGAGFGSYSQCHRVFQRTLGCAPRRFFETALRGQIQDALEPWDPPGLRLDTAAAGARAPI